MKILEGLHASVQLPVGFFYVLHISKDYQKPSLMKKEKWLIKKKKKSLHVYISRVDIDITAGNY